MLSAVNEPKFGYFVREISESWLLVATCIHPFGFN